MIPELISYTLPKIFMISVIFLRNMAKTLLSSQMLIKIIVCMVAMVTSMISKIYTCQKYNLDIRFCDALNRIPEL